MSIADIRDLTSHQDALRMVRDIAAGSARRPLIGVTSGTAVLTAGAWEGSRATVLVTAYTDAIREAGGRPVILTPDEPWSPEELADLDALVLTGGTDIDPARYGASPLPTDFAPDPERDAFEIDLARAAHAANLPLLGICRGLQIINVALGGALLQHLDDAETCYPEASSAVTEVDIETDAGSAVADALTTRATVRAYHHQAVSTLAPGLRVTARHAASGVVHAVEGTGPGWLLGVQFHPEIALETRGVLRLLVTAAAAQAAKARSAASSVRIGLAA